MDNNFFIPSKLEALPQPMDTETSFDDIKICIKLLAQDYVVQEYRHYPEDFTVETIFRLIRFEHSQTEGCLSTTRLSVPYHLVHLEFNALDVPEHIRTGHVEVSREFGLWHKTLGEMDLKEADMFICEFQTRQPFLTKPLNVGIHLIAQDEFTRWYHSYILGEKVTDDGTKAYCVKFLGFKSQWNEWILATDQGRFKNIGTTAVEVEYKWYLARPHTDFEDEQQFHREKTRQLSGESKPNAFDCLEKSLQRLKRAPESTIPSVSSEDLHEMLKHLDRERKKLQESCESIKKQNSELVKKLRMTKLKHDLQTIDMRELQKNKDKAECAIKQMSGHDIKHLELPGLRMLRKRVWSSLQRIESEIEEKESVEYTCSVCLTGTNNHALVPCGHRFCPECIPRFSRCPICRKQFFQTVELF